MKLSFIQNVFDSVFLLSFASYLAHYQMLMFVLCLFFSLDFIWTFGPLLVSSSNQLSSRY